jgi:hypothetical protein
VTSGKQVGEVRCQQEEVDTNCSYQKDIEQKYDYISWLRCWQKFNLFEDIIIISLNKTTAFK